MQCMLRRCCVCLPSCPPVVQCMLSMNEMVGLLVGMCRRLSRKGNAMRVGSA